MRNNVEDCHAASSVIYLELLRPKYLPISLVSRYTFTSRYLRVLYDTVKRDIYEEKYLLINLYNFRHVLTYQYIHLYVLF